MAVTFRDYLHYAMPLLRCCMILFYAMPLIIYAITMLFMLDAAFAGCRHAYASVAAAALLYAIMLMLLFMLFRYGAITLRCRYY